MLFSCYILQQEKLIIYLVQESIAVGCVPTAKVSSTPMGVGVSRRYTNHYQGQGQSSRPTAALINIREPLI